MKKCELCDCLTGKTIKIKNKKNGNELEICRGCAVKHEFMKMPAGTHWECTYCGYPNSVPYPGEPDFMACGRCGAEWEDCKVLVDDEVYLGIGSEEE